MKKVASFLAGAMVMVAVACGGSTRDSDSSNGSGASGGSAGRGGSGGSAFGSGGGGVDGSGGSLGSLGSAGEAGSGGYTDGGIPPTDCKAPPQSYSCEGGDRSFYFDSAAGVCKPYGSFRCSYTSANRFTSLSDCLATCPDARPDIAACDDVSDCAIVDTGCCAACEPVARDAVTVVNRARTNDFKPPCPPVACSPCPPADELATTRQYFVATCGFGTCGMLDVRITTYTECTADTDCHLRDGAQCCEECDGKGLVALNSEPRPQLCSPNVDCAACVPRIPPEFAPKCEEARCKVTRRPIP